MNIKPLFAFITALDGSWPTTAQNSKSHVTRWRGLRMVYSRDVKHKAQGRIRPAKAFNLALSWFVMKVKNLIDVSIVWLFCALQHVLIIRWLSRVVVLKHFFELHKGIGQFMKRKGKPVLELKAKNLCRTFAFTVDMTEHSNNLNKVLPGLKKKCHTVLW